MPTKNTKTDNAKTVKTDAKAASPRQIAQAAHDAAGFTGRTGCTVSPNRNSGSRDAIDTTTAKSAKRTYAQLTPRMHGALNDLAKAHGDKPFPARYIDRAQAARFINSGFLLRAGQSGDVSDGIYRDGKTPLMLKLSADTLKRYA